jgi:hypothetical protein
MKIWNSYGSEHSANIVIVGTFDNVTEAQKAKQIIDNLTDIFQKDIEKNNANSLNGYEKFSEEMLEYIGKQGTFDITHYNVTGLLSDVAIKQEFNKISIASKDFNFQIFLNIMLQNGAKIEIENR